jgi:hypothetical protein
MKTKVPCLLCANPIEDLDPVSNQPSGGVEFLTRGHYGCTVFDPMDGSTLVINICDPCLTTAMQNKLVLYNKMKIWDGE